MSDDLGIRHGVLDAWLAQHVAGFEGLEAVSKFGDGQSNPTYLLIARSGRYVLRAKPAGDLLKSAHMVEREYRVMAALADTDVPVPPVFTLSEGAASPIGRTFFVMGYLDGQVFWDPALPDLTPPQRGQAYDRMNEVLAALHDIDPDRIGLSDYGRPGDYFARQTDRWSRQYRASVDAPSAAMAHLMTSLPLALPADDGAVSLVHGDYRLDNMMFSPDGARVLGLLDWELSTLGHPLADLAYQCMQWRLPHDGPMPGLGGLDRAALGLPSEADYIAAYCARRGLAGIDHWPVLMAFAAFRLAAILAGVVARARAGNASNPETARVYGTAIPLLEAMAMELVEGTGG